ncbi:MAG TPA: hypothetical protein VF519_10125 [Mycobacteriales bacterium]
MTISRTRRSALRLAVTGIAAAGLMAVFVDPAVAGYGGIQATTTSTYWSIGATGQYYGTSYTDWYSPSWSTCTHAYPNNDMYRNNVSGFDYFTFDYTDVGSNCNRVVLYRDGVQGGGGAVNCYRNSSGGGTCGPLPYTYYSISWHNR